MDQGWCRSTTKEVKRAGTHPGYPGGTQGKSGLYQGGTQVPTYSPAKAPYRKGISILFLRDGRLKMGGYLGTLALCSASDQRFLGTQAGGYRVGTEPLRWVPPWSEGVSAVLTE